MSSNLAGLIDHTLLKADAAYDDIITLCNEAKEYKFASVCVNPVWVKICSEQLQATEVRVCTVIGFPLGANATETKVFETKKAIQDGAREVDMVINIGALKGGDNALAEKEIAAVVQEAKDKALVKVIIETSLLTEEEKVRACIMSKNAGANFVKTSTGFSTGGATVEDIELMRKTVGPDMGVKASGGIRNRQTCLEMLQAGATRFGASSGVSIVREEG